MLVTLCGCLVFNCLSADAYTPPKAYFGPFGNEAGSGKTRVLSSGMQKFVAFYLKENDEELAQIRDRSAEPFMIIDSVMDHYELPEDLRYLAVIESELRATAVSRVGARGPWQLMAGTARDLGLKVGHRSDERTNYYKSTTAAALYLRDLHREFRDWLLVLAAYNAGPGPVQRAIRLAGSRNFWVLERYLPGETRQHVRRFIATAYYFAISGPVSDPAPVGTPMLMGPGGHDLSGGEGVPGLRQAGLSDGVMGDVSLGAVGVGALGAGVGNGTLGVGSEVMGYTNDFVAGCAEGEMAERRE